jgi:hypothetical protein
LENKMKNKIIYGLMLTVLSFGALAQNTPAGSTAVSGTNHSGDTTLIFKDMGQDPGASQGANTVDLQQIVFPVASGGGPVSVTPPTGGGSTGGGGSPPTVSTAPIVAPPPQVCPAGTTGTYPNCVAISTTITTPPPKTCPSGTTGTYPNCVAISTTPPPSTTPPKTCPSGTVGTYPNCSAPTCTNGATNYPTCTLTCPAGTTGTYPNCVAASTANIQQLTYGNRGQGGLQQWGGVVVNGQFIGNITLKNNLPAGNPAAAPTGSVFGAPITSTSKNSNGTTTSNSTYAIAGAGNAQVGTLSKSTTTSNWTKSGTGSSTVISSTTATATTLVVGGVTYKSVQTCTSTLGRFSSCTTKSGQCVVRVCTP